MKQLFEIFNQFDDGIIISDKSGNIEFVNEAADRFFNGAEERGIAGLLGEEAITYPGDSVFPVFYESGILTVKKADWNGFDIFRFSVKDNSGISEKIDVLDRVGRNLNEDLTTMLMAMNLLFSERPQDEKDRKYTSILYHSYFKIRHLASDVSELCGFFSNDIKLDKKAVDIVEVISDLVDSICHFLDDDKISISFSTALDMKLTLLDEDRLERMLLTTIANSIKNIGRKGKISVFLEMAQEKFVITVSDTGKNLDKGALSGIFTPDGVGSVLNKEGMGLGLVAYTARLMGGSVMLSSSETSGTTVKIILPYTPPEGLQLKEAGEKYRLSGMNEIYTHLSDVLSYDKYSSLYMD